MRALRGARDAQLRCVYVDLDGTLLGPGGALLRDADEHVHPAGRPRAARPATAPASRSCSCPAGARRTVKEDARLFAQPAYIFEAGSCLVIDGEEHWLTGDYLPHGEAGTIHDQIEASGAPALLLEHYAGRLEYHDPWHHGREVSHLFRGLVDAAEADALLAEHGHGGLRLVDNGGVHRRSPTSSRSTRCAPTTSSRAGASKADAVARHMRVRGFAPRGRASPSATRARTWRPRRSVGTFWFVANAVERDPTLREAIGGRTNVRVAEESHGAGVYEAVVTTLAERLTPRSLAPQPAPRSPAAGAGASAPAAGPSCARARSTRRAAARRR